MLSPMYLNLRDTTRYYLYPHDLSICKLEIFRGASDTQLLAVFDDDEASQIDSCKYNGDDNEHVLNAVQLDPRRQRED